MQMLANIFRIYPVEPLAGTTTWGIVLFKGPRLCMCVGGGMMAGQEEKQGRMATHGF